MGRFFHIIFLRAHHIVPFISGTSLIQPDRLDITFNSVFLSKSIFRFAAHQTQFHLDCQTPDTIEPVIYCIMIACHNDISQVQICRNMNSYKYSILVPKRQFYSLEY